PVFSEDKPLYVFASHSHGDHFNPEIFRLTKQYPQVHFVLSHDIWMTRKKHTRAGVAESNFEQAVYMRAHETKEFSAITVTTLRSTDMGVAFLVKYGDLKIYHAGDLHWWLWPGDTKQAAGNMTANYQREIGHLRELLSPQSSSSTAKSSTVQKSRSDALQPQLDLAFLPLDGRLEENYALGITYFLQQISVRHVFPMHFWEDYEVVERYAATLPQNDPNPCAGDTAFFPILHKISQPGQSWFLSEILS
ncbi:MAG: MBL fold metallo-hydrolase, partial [Lachnospiraceae bacterium]|nr:MBL fold metallo-hydrolase [Lachnospiraceae bacterium]